MSGRLERLLGIVLEGLADDLGDRVLGQVVQFAGVGTFVITRLFIRASACFQAVQTISSVLFLIYSFYVVTKKRFMPVVRYDSGASPRSRLMPQLLRQGK